MTGAQGQSHAMEWRQRDDERRCTVRRSNRLVDCRRPISDSVAAVDTQRY